MCHRHFGTFNQTETRPRIIYREAPAPLPVWRQPSLYLQDTIDMLENLMKDVKKDNRFKEYRDVIKEVVVPSITSSAELAELLFALHRIRFGIITNERFEQIKNDVILGMVDRKYDLYNDTFLPLTDDPNENTIRMLVVFIRTLIKFGDARVL